MGNNKTMKKDISPQNLNRLAISLIEHYDCTYDDAIIKLNNLKLLIHCTECVYESSSLKAALLTSINTSKRCFLGGVFVLLEKSDPSLESMVINHGAYIVKNTPEPDFTINIGTDPQNELQVRIMCNGWLGGIKTFNDSVDFSDCYENEYPICGVMAAAIAVHSAFMKVTGIDYLATEFSKILSLWKPELHWSDNDAMGPKIEFLPKKFWILGLGHLGQAYLWNINFLPYKDPTEVTVLLQDYDKIEIANYSSGLLSNEGCVGNFKTRICSEWLEEKSFNTVITERKYDKNTKVTEEEPRIALCGFDVSEPRLYLEKSGFDLVVECGLGGKIDNFDEILVHTFPNSINSAETIWGSMTSDLLQQKNVLKNLTFNEECGILVETLAGKAISASFVGAFAGSFVISEILKAYNDGNQSETISISMREFENKYIVNNMKYKSQASRNGFIKIL